VVTKNISGISLNNSGGDKVIIYQPDGNQLEMIEYSSSALEGKAYAKKPDGSWVWTAEATPGSQNSFIANQPPEAKFNLSNQKIKVDQSIEFDGSLSIDPDGDQIIYHWDFGDGSDGDEIKETHIFETSGSFNIILTVTDSEGLADASTKQVVVSLSDESPKSTPVQSIISDYNSITINEFLVNPVSSDDFEWIELFNNSSEKLDLSNLKIDDAAGGSQPFQLKELFIEPFGYLIINRVDSKIALNNSADSVRLLSAEDQVIQEVIYDSAKEGQSFSYNQILNDWFWSAEPTPGTENPLPFVGNFSISGNIDNQNSNYQISEIKELDKGAEVKTYGIITAVPGIFGKRSFYISEVDLPNQKIFLSPGIEIYSSRAEFLAMSIGDVVELSGKVSETQGRKRINLQNDSQINFIEHWEVPEPDKFATGELSDDLVGSLIKIAGVLLERKNSNYYLDDGSGELIMYLKKTAGIPKLEVGEGYIIEAVGILDSTDSGYRLLPRFPTDISAGQVLGEFEEIELSDEVINIEAKDQRKKMMKYLMFGGGGVMIILITIVIKLKLKINKDG